MALRTYSPVLTLVIAVACSKQDEPKRATPATEPPAPAAAPAAPAIPHQVFDAPADAVAHVLARKPRVIGFGEYHQTRSTAHIRSAISRFTTDMLPALRGHASDLVVETWAEYGNCDAKATAAAAAVKHDTERPATTENEVLALLAAAKDSGVHPHVLPFDCADYHAVTGDDGQVDYEKMLLLITHRLRDVALVLLEREETGTIAMYGGATHNDLYPYESVADFSYVQKVQERAGGSYVEVDLLVPEFAAGDKLLPKEPWFALVAQAPPGKVVLIERDPGSFVIAFPPSPRPPADQRK